MRDSTTTMTKDLGLDSNPGRAVVAAVAAHGRAAVKELTRSGNSESYPDAVHEFRKHVKQMRALLRLVRPWLGDEGTDANAELRSAGHLLAGARDATVAVETLDALADGAVPHPWPSLKGRLAARAAAANDELRLHSERGAAAVEVVGALSRRCEDWPVEAIGATELASALARSYRRGRRRLAEVEEAPTTEALHELRKRAKDLRYQVAFLAPARPALLTAWEDELHLLTDQIGDDHDLANVELAARPMGGLEGRAMAELRDRRSELQGNAVALARRLYAARPATIRALVTAQLCEHEALRLPGVAAVAAQPS